MLLPCDTPVTMKKDNRFSEKWEFFLLTSSSGWGGQWFTLKMEKLPILSNAAENVCACVCVRGRVCVFERAHWLKGSMVWGDLEPIIFSLMVPQVRGGTTKRLEERSVRTIKLRFVATVDETLNPSSLYDQPSAQTGGGGQGGYWGQPSKCSVEAYQATGPASNWNICEFHFHYAWVLNHSETWMAQG